MFLLTTFYSQQMKISVIIFLIYVITELPKKIARANLHCKRDCNTNYDDIIRYTSDWKITHTNYVDITEHVHWFCFLPFYSVPFGLVDIALAKLGHSRSVWGAILHTYPQSFLLYLTCRTRIITKCTFFKKNLMPAVEALTWTDSRWAVSLLQICQCTCLWVLFLFRIGLHTGSKFQQIFTLKLYENIE